MPANQVLLIEPKSFNFNEETALDNTFQSKSSEDASTIQAKAKHEFDALVNALTTNGVEVLVIPDLLNSNTPDSIFPNNWISTHKTGEIVIYPMFAESRRNEVRHDIVEIIKAKLNAETVHDFTAFLDENKFLEGTGSLVLDRENEIAYCCLSERSHLEILKKWTELMNYEMVYFNAENEDGIPIYHTNVMMAVAKEYVIICLDSIPDIDQRMMVIEVIEESEKDIIELSYDQLNQFAGNMLELTNDIGESLLVMSAAAYKSLTDEQITWLSNHSKLIQIPIPTIEKNGGGSVRCMIAELYPTS